MNPELVAKINADVGKVLAMPDFEKRITALPGEEVATSVSEFNRLVSDEIIRWAAVVKKAGISIN